MVIINMTPHDVVVLSPFCAKQDEKTKKFLLEGILIEKKVYPSQGCARVLAKSELVGVIDTVSVYSNNYELDSSVLPEEREGTYYIVSALVKTHSTRKDLLVPNQVVYDTNNCIVGCLSFSQ